MLEGERKALDEKINEITKPIKGSTLGYIILALALVALVLLLK